jgi:WD40 repeat protein
MLVKAKTKLVFDNDWLSNLKFRGHTDYDLIGAVDAISVKSNDGSVYSFYKEEFIEKPEDFKLTKLYHVVPVLKNIVDYFEIPSTRIRIHKQDPNKLTKLHTDDNNVFAKSKEDYRLRFFTALSASEDFYYYFKEPHKDEITTLKLEQGETIVFDPDLVQHGMENKSKDSIRYSLIQIVKPYPITPWLKSFLYEEKEIIIR